jgi:anti-sigma regulatory factor (Ser/Thr protein kinase)
MTAHRAALPVTTEVSGVSRVGFLAAGTPQGLRPPGHLLPAQPQPVGPSYGPPAQPSTTCQLGARPESVKTGRDFTRATLADWGLSALTDLAELVVSELVTNALRHGVPSARQLGAEHCIRLRLLAQAPFVMCMVTDPGIEIPVLRESGPTCESGRGLNVVECCSVRWGWHLLDEGGKVVWALLRPPL